ncbi:helical backbone metal receptor [Haloplanus aerogenes]|uniref:Cobalamin-binding protein n=1 Tax=Haloplanus aerogenes TaxID=660522 RepID=A0A3M0CXJ1_9EURY|nr:helical backbone metal receptor [Haloplanus aerogenes]AZH24927.1 cobalamin-binding protein [Haloplanus aerogenes]RMB13861.1 iron complex transport system substrate-binding protein [Haloplanus aerogenes]
MSPPDRIVSLAPAATATCRELGVADRLVGITTHCRSELDGDPAVLGGWLDPDLDELETLDPDLVCTSDGLQAVVRDAIRERGIRVYHMDARTLPTVIEGFAALGDAVGRGSEGERLAERSRERLDRLRERRPADRPTVYCEEWAEPPMAAGNWIPEVVEAAGGHHPFVEPGERSRAITQDAVEAADPDHVVLHLCDHGSQVDPATFTDRDWDVDATVHVVDDRLLNQPSPNLIDGAERLAELF